MHVQAYVKEHGKMGPAFGHAGMVLSAEAILKDMDDHGVLDTLLRGEDYKGQQYVARFHHVVNFVLWVFRSLRDILLWEVAPAESSVGM